MTIQFPSPAFDDALAAMLADVATDEQRAALGQCLAHDPAARAAYLRQSTLHARLLTRSAATMVAPLSTHQRGHSIVRSRISRGWALATAAGVLVCAASWLWLTNESATGLIVASADARVRIDRHGAAHWGIVGDALAVGDTIETAEASIVVSYPLEETRIELAPQTRLQLLDHRGGKKLRLLAGALSAEVAPQPEGAPLRLFTQYADAVVLGTRFTLSADAPLASLAVQKGAVRVNRRQAGESITVSSQERVDLTAARLEVREELSTPPTPWRDAATLGYNFEQGSAWPHLRIGRITDRTDSNPGHCVAGELYAGENPWLKFGVALHTRFVVQDGSRLRLRYWASADVEWIQVILHCQGSGRGYLARIDSLVHERWGEWSLPLAELKLSYPNESGQQPNLASGAIGVHLNLMTSRAGTTPQLFFDDLMIEQVHAP